MRLASKLRAFTLVELIAVIAIIAMMASLVMPEYKRMIDRANSVACAGNLRQIGTSLGLYLNDHDQTFPFINNPYAPAYDDPNETPPDNPPQTIEQALGPYGATGPALRCRSDVAFNNYYGKWGTSYEWRPLLDGEPKVNPVIYTRRGAIRIATLSRLRIAFDIEAVHNGRPNSLYADGSVRTAP